MKLNRLTVGLAAAMALGFGANLVWAGGEKCAAQHSQADYSKMAEKMAKKGYLGIETEKNASGGYAVTSIVAGSPAERAGFQVGDVLVAINGTRLGEDNKEAVSKVKSTLGPGSTVNYTVQRAGADRAVTATLAEVPREVLAQWVGEHVLEHTTLVVAAN